MSLYLFNLFRVGRPAAATPGWFGQRRRARFERHQTALRGPDARLWAKRLSRRSGTPQKPLRAGEAVTHYRRLDPRRVTASGRRRGESRLPPADGPARSRVGSVRQRLARRAASARRTAVALGRCLFSSGLISRQHARLPAGGQSLTDGVRRMPQRDAGGLRLKRSLADRGRRVAPGSAAAPRAGPEFLGTHQGPFMAISFSWGFGLSGLTPSGTAPGRTAPACATSSKPPGRSSPPGWRGPSVYPSSFPAGPTTTSPPAPPGP